MNIASLSSCAALLGALAATSAEADTPAAGEALVAAKCAACHEAQPGSGGYARIAESRRTPEGWEMTVARMSIVHGVALSADERRRIVAHLADTAGLAPAESEAWRYILERRPQALDKFENPRVGETCARCHSYARIALQRRSEAEWRRLSHFHVGQFPTLELQNASRDRDWWQTASTEIPGLLAALYPLQSEAWSAWQAQPKADPAGDWRLAGQRPGWGDYEGTMRIARAGEAYTLSVELRYADGRTQRGEGQANLFTGYEWRASLSQGEEKIRQVFALAADGAHLSGRWFLADVDVLGGELRATRAGPGAAPEILAVQPARLKAGARQSIAIHGVGLDGDVSLGKGVRVLRVVRRTPETIVVEAQADRAAATGARTVQVGAVAAAAGLAVYRRIDALRIEPATALARVGGGPRTKSPVQFEAVAYAAGADGRSGTADDLRLGSVSVRWRIANLNPAARAMRDADFAGTIDARGLFVPGAAGPNRKRKFATNNAGELKVSATLADGGRQLRAEAPLVVTVQRWNDPPIR